MYSLGRAWGWVSMYRIELLKSVVDMQFVEEGAVQRPSRCHLFLDQNLELLHLCIFQGASCYVCTFLLLHRFINH